MGLPSLPTHRVIYALQRLEQVLKDDPQLAEASEKLLQQIEKRFCAEWHMTLDIKHSLKIIRSLRTCGGPPSEAASLLFARALSSRLHRLTPAEFAHAAEEISRSSLPFPEKLLLLTDVAKEFMGEAFLVGSLDPEQIRQLAEDFSTSFGSRLV